MAGVGLALAFTRMGTTRMGADPVDSFPLAAVDGDPDTGGPGTGTPLTGSLHTRTPDTAPIAITPASAPVNLAAIGPAKITIAEESCHPDYEPCLRLLPGDALDCGNLGDAQKPVVLHDVTRDPYALDRDNDGIGCEDG